MVRVWVNKALMMLVLVVQLYDDDDDENNNNKRVNVVVLSFYYYYSVIESNLSIHNGFEAILNGSIVCVCVGAKGN